MTEVSSSDIDESVNQTKRSILVIDDDQSIRDSLRLLLQNNFEVATAESGLEIVDLVSEQAPDLILLDVMMPGCDGLEALKKLHTTDHNIPVIMLTADNTVETAVEAMKLGAVDYMVKPFDIEVLTNLIVSTLKIDSSKIVSTTTSTMEASTQVSAGNIIGNTDSMKTVLESVERVAVRDTTVLITGESGTGKELFAKKVHDASGRCDGPFIALNCGAIPETLIESELFGHEKGSFTNAVESRAGYCELADGGTLFLDEIGELSLPVQVKLLRFLQEREFYRIGRSQPVKVSVRVIAATNKDLETLMEQKLFRQDLYYRINVVNIKLPPLRDRFEDIPVLIDHFQKKFSPIYGNRLLQFSEEALAQLVQYAWPGNVRELENVVESLMALASTDTVGVNDLPPKVKEVLPLAQDELQVFRGGLNFHDAERAFETEIIVKALRKTNFVQTRAAELLGISRRILKYKMDKLGISEDGQTLPADTAETIDTTEPDSAPGIENSETG